MTTETPAAGVATADEMQNLRAIHSRERSPSAGDYCLECDWDYPCVTLRVLDELETLRRAAGRAQLRAWRCSTVICSMPVWLDDDHVPEDILMACPWCGDRTLALAAADGAGEES